MNRIDYLTNKETDILAPQTGDTLEVVDVSSLPNVNELGMAIPGASFHPPDSNGISWNALVDPPSFSVSGVYIGGGGGGSTSSYLSGLTSMYPSPDPVQAPEVITQDLLRSVARQEQVELQSRVDMLNAQMIQMYETIDRLRASTSVIAPLEGDQKANGDDI